MGKPLQLVLCAGLIAGSGCRTPGAFDARGRDRLARSVIAGWSSPSRFAAAAAIERFGPPDAVASWALGWRSPKPWLRVVVHDEPGRELEEIVSHPVPESRRAALQAFGRGVSVVDNGEAMSSRSSEEGLNFLALNLGAEVARGVRTPADARRSYDRIRELSLAGKSSPYLKGLLFPSPQ